MDVVKEGFGKIKSKRYGIWWQRWLVLHRATSKGTTRLSIYSNNKSTKDKPKSSLSVHSIQTVKRLTSKVKKYAIAIVTGDNSSWELSFETESDAEDWLNAVLLEQQKRGVAKFFSSPGVHNRVKSDLDTDQYDVYPVCPMAYTQLGDFHGECLMVLTPESIHLLDADQPSNYLVSWKIKHLRKFGLNAGRLLIESGKNSRSGEGIFVFTSIYSEEIYERLRQHAHVLARSVVLENSSHSDSVLSLDSAQSNDQLVASWSSGESS